MRNFMQLITAMWAQGKFVSVGLDPDIEKIPKHIRALMSDPGKYTVGDWIFAFNKGIIDKTHDIACVYKLNYAFYEKYGNVGLDALRETIKYINKVAPNVPVILDFKRADIDNTNIGSVKAGFEDFNADAVTVNPYFGKEALKPFLDNKEKGIIVLAATSNKGAGEIQDLPVLISENPIVTKPVYQIVAENVNNNWNENGNCAIVIGATVPEKLAIIRKSVGNLLILLPGIGKQGGDLQKALEAGFTPEGTGIIVNNSREIIYASDGEDFAEAAREKTLKLHEAIVAYRTTAFAQV